MMIDQVPASKKHAIEIEFLGRPAYVDRAPAVVAASRGAPLVIAASRREANGVHVLAVLDVVEPPTRPSKEWATQATRTATRALERFVRQHPDQWLWLHRRWKRLDPDDLGSTLRKPCPNPSTRSSSPAAASRAA
jgi:KDO2-lipid IV(A) lauroyltransferase